jgi:hypothetical protein
MGKIIIVLPNPSPPSSDFIDRKSLLLLINKFIDYNYRIYSTPITISSMSTNEIKTTHQGERQAYSVDKYQAFKMPLSLLKRLRVLAIMLSSKTQVIMPALTTEVFQKLPSYLTMHRIIRPAKQSSFPPARHEQPDHLLPQCPELAQVASLPKKPARWDFASSSLSLCYSVIYTCIVFGSITSIL